MGFPFDVVVVAANASVDSYYLLPELTIGDVNRGLETLHTAGGKGNNMARAISLLGGRPLSLGIVGGHSGQFIRDELQREDIEADLVEAEAETRRCATMVTTSPALTTVVLESGQAVGAAAREALTERVRSHTGDAPYFALTGSLPSDFPDSYYADLIVDLKQSSARVAIDCAGQTLLAAVHAHPSNVKINMHEFLTAFGLDRWDWRLAAAIISNFGLDLMIVTDGPKGAYVFANEADPFHVMTQVESWLNTTGAGDTFMAGLLLSLNRGEALAQAVSCASAAAAASLQQLGSGYLVQADVDRFVRLTHIEILEDSG